MHKTTVLLIATAALSASAYSWGSTLECSSAYTKMSAEIDSTGYSKVRVISSDGEDLHASDLSLLSRGETVSSFAVALNADDDSCTISLPNQAAGLKRFQTHLVCEDQNGKIVNDDPIVSESGALIHGEPMRCSVK